MLYRTYLDKFCTISRENPDVNTGISPVGILIYGDKLTRILAHFPIEAIKTKIESKETPDITKYRHILRITNSSGVDLSDLHKAYDNILGSKYDSKRASSFDLIFFLIPEVDFDNGKGFDFVYDDFSRSRYSSERLEENTLVSIDGASWNKPSNGNRWIHRDDKGHFIYGEDGFLKNNEGVYSIAELAAELDWEESMGEKSDIIIAKQHFDIGAEDVAVDITDTVNKMILGEIPNHGIGIAFSPVLEDICNQRGMPIFQRFCGLLGPRTNTFFEPFVESVYNDVIEDDRGLFTLNRKNRLYLYTTVGGTSKNLDELPLCTIRDDNGDIVTDKDGRLLENIEAQQTTIGAYYIELTIGAEQYEDGIMLYDTWTNVKYEGVEFPPVELDFVTKASDSYFKFGNSVEQAVPNYEPTVSGIKQDEEIRRGDVRKLTIESIVPYSKSSGKNVENIFWRMYVYDGQRQIEVVPFEPVNRTTSDNYVLIDTSMLIPQRYYIDIKYTNNMQEITHHEVLRFKIAQILNNKYA